MEATMITLKAFLDGAHKTGITDCCSAEKHLALAKAMLRPKTQEEKKELQRIIKELEQIHTVCSTPNKFKDDDPGYIGV